MRSTKKCRDDKEARFQALWLNVTGQNVGAKAKGDTLHLTYFPGMMSNNWQAVWLAARDQLWNAKPATYQPYDPHAYVQYVEETHHCIGYAWRSVFTMIRNAAYTPVSYCHGDMTLENVIICEHDPIRFIDPGYPRGLPTRELDESKLLQSLDGWHEIKWNQCPRSYPAFKMKPIHVALLCTHYIRLLKHDHKPDLLEFAHDRLEHWLAFIKEMT